MIDLNDNEVSEAWKYFESAWRRGKPQNLWEAISSVSPVFRRDLAVEFAMIELEWRWRLGLDDAPRNTRYYADLLTALKLEAEHYVTMLEHEFIVRSQWGDRPTVDEILEGFPADTGLHSVLQSALDENFPVYCFLKDGNTRAIEHRLKLFTEFGCQGAGDDDKFSFSGDESSMRCVIADANESTIAESQLTLKRVGADRVLACNQSPTANCRTSERTLAADAPVEIRLPVTLYVESLQLHLDCGF